MLSPRPYQIEAIEATNAAIARGINRPLIALPTGTGKTVVFAHFIKQRDGRALILAHRDELLRQAGDKIKTITPGANIGYVKAEEDDHHHPITIASVQTLSRQNRLDRLDNDYDTIIVDEAHHAAAESYQRVIRHLRGFDERDAPVVLGVTATPERGDGIGLNCVFQEIVYQKSILEMIDADFLCDLKAIEIKLKVDFNELRTRAGDFIDSEVEAFMRSADAPAHIVEAFMTHAHNRKTILFTPTVALAHEIAGAFCAAGYRAEALDGTTPTDARRGILARLHSGLTQIVCNCGVLTEGFDEPSVDCIIIARPTKSKTLYIQMIGRGTRKFATKEDCLIMDVVGISNRHDLQTVTNLFGLPPGALAKKTLTEVLDEMAQQQAMIDAQRAVQGEIVAQKIDLFRKSRLHWLPKNDGRFLLSTGQGLLVVRERQGGWAVEFNTKDNHEVLIDHLTQEYAMGFAEDEARELGAGSLIDPNAAWRKAPASTKQIETLRKFRVAFDESKITKGEASDLMTLAIADFRKW
jgi:ATP-dependent helicase IRC3